MTNILSTFKQNLLGHSLIRVRRQVPNTQVLDAATHKKDIIGEIIRIADEERKISVHTDADDKFTVFSAVVLVMPMGDFKYCVEAAISLLSDEQLDNVRKGGNMPKVEGEK